MIHHIYVSHDMATPVGLYRCQLNTVHTLHSVWPICCNKSGNKLCRWLGLFTDYKL